LPLHASIEQAFSERVASLYPAADLERMRLPVAIGVCSQALLARLSYADDVTIHGLSVAPGLADLGRVQMEHVNGQFPAGTAEDLSRLLQIAVAPSEGRLAAARPGGTPGLGSLALMIEESREERARIQKLAGRLVASGAFPMKGPEDTSGAVRHARAQASGILRVNMDAVLATARVLAVRTSITGAEAEEILFGAGDRLPN
jgi:hypothetical protein